MATTAETDKIDTQCPDCGADLGEHIRVKWIEYDDPEIDPVEEPANPVGTCEMCGCNVTKAMGAGAVTGVIDARVLDARRTAEKIKGAGALTARESDVSAFREAHDVSRQETAEELGVSPSRVDNALRSAHDKIASGRIIVNMVDDNDWGRP